MRLKESDFSIGRGQQIDDSFYHFGSKRKSSLREVLSLKGVFPARNWQKEITFLTYYPFYIYVQPNKKYIHKRWPISEILQPIRFWDFPYQFRYWDFFPGPFFSIPKPSKDGHKYRSTLGNLKTSHSVYNILYHGWPFSSKYKSLSLCRSVTNAGPRQTSI